MNLSGSDGPPFSGQTPLCGVLRLATVPDKACSPLNPAETTVSGGLHVPGFRIVFTQSQTIAWGTLRRKFQVACHGSHDAFRNPGETCEFPHSGVAEVVVMYLHCGAVEETDSLSSWWNGNVASLLDNHRWQYAQTGDTLIQLPGKALTLLMGAFDTNPPSVDNTLLWWKDKGCVLDQTVRDTGQGGWLAVFVGLWIGCDFGLQGIRCKKCKMLLLINY